MTKRNKTREYNKKERMNTQRKIRSKKNGERKRKKNTNSKNTCRLKKKQ